MEWCDVAQAANVSRHTVDLRNSKYWTTNISVSVRESEKGSCNKNTKIVETKKEKDRLALIFILFGVSNEVK